MTDIYISKICIKGNVNNKFMLLSHTQFIENRVYDEDDEDQSILKDDETNSKLNGNMKGDMKHDKDPEEEFAENVTMALQSSFDFVDESFHQVEVSDIWSKHESKNLLSNGLSSDPINVVGRVLSIRI